MLLLQTAVALVFFLSALPASAKETHFVGSVHAFTPAEVDAGCKRLRDAHAIAQCAHPNPGRLARRHVGRRAVTALDPVILVPGLGASQLEAKLSKTGAPAWYCVKEWDWFRMWLDLSQLVTQDCMFDNLRVEYNATSNTYANPSGVETRPIDFGGMGGVDFMSYIFDFPVPLTGYFHDMIMSLRAVGYRPRKTLYAAPYDWRVPTTEAELRGYFADLKALVATARSANNGRKVHIVSHSMGGPTILRFFNNQNQKWLDDNIATFIPVASPWSGAPQSLRAVISGDDFGLNALGFSLLSKERVMEVARQSGGVIMYIPDPEFFPRDKVFVEANIDGRVVEYTAADFDQLFDAAGTHISAVIHDKTERIINPGLGAPRVVTHCVFGYGVQTEIAYNYTNGLGAQPVISYTSNGDGMVPMESLRECTSWMTEQTQLVTIKELDVVGHTDILSDQDLFDYIIGIIMP